MKYQDRTQIYKGALTRRWNENRGEISLILKHANNVSGADNNGPFTYVGDGSVSLLDGFNLGRDAYMPSAGTIGYQGVVTGDTIQKHLYDMGYSHNNEIGLRAKYLFNNGGLLTFNFKFNRAHSGMANNALAGLSEVADNSGYTTIGGTPFAGYVQSRYSLYSQGRVSDVLATAEYKQRFSNHILRFGLNQGYNSTELKMMTSNWAHTVEAAPEHLLYHGNAYWDFNTGAEYYNGSENKLALYVSDDWNILRNAVGILSY